MTRVGLVMAIVGSTLPLSLLVNRLAPDPYMDEIFHIPQTKQYCYGDFKTWHPLITTFPGLYFISLAILSPLLPALRILGMVEALPELCSPPILRSMNLIFACICGLLFREIIAHVDPKISPNGASMKAFVLALYPLHWFFTFLYYTDVASTTAVMAMYLACLKKAYWASGMLGMIAILVRQTNVVWAVFVTFIGVVEYLKDADSRVVPKALEDNPPAFIRLDRFSMGQLQKRNRVVKKNSSKVYASSIMKMKVGGILEEMVLLVQKAWSKKGGLIWQFSLMILDILAFLMFLFWNGSIVLGAKEAHQASLHFAQVMYFSGAVALALASLFFNPRQVAIMLRKKGWLLLASLIVALFCIHFGSMAHPYLVSDNRHYTFYIWRKVINACQGCKYWLAPFYAFSWASILHLLGGKQEDKLRRLVFCVGVMAVLVPAPLIEFRYYTIPLYFIALHISSRDHQAISLWCLIGLEYVAVNSFTMYLFLYRPFRWPTEPGFQRFIW